jgi:peroxiredoxin
MLETGQLAPDFTLPDQDGEGGQPRKTAKQEGRLYFYPKADT